MCFAYLLPRIRSLPRISLVQGMLMFWRVDSLSLLSHFLGLPWSVNPRAEALVSFTMAWSGELFGIYAVRVWITGQLVMWTVGDLQTISWDQIVLLSWVFLPVQRCLLNSQRQLTVSAVPMKLSPLCGLQRKHFGMGMTTSRASDCVFSKRVSPSSCLWMDVAVPVPPEAGFVLGGAVSSGGLHNCFLVVLCWLSCWRALGQKSILYTFKYPLHF